MQLILLQLQSALYGLPQTPFQLFQAPAVFLQAFAGMLELAAQPVQCLLLLHQAPPQVFCKPGLKARQLVQQFPPIGTQQFCCRRWRRCPDVGHEIRYGEIRFVPHRADHGQLAGGNGAGYLLVVKTPEVFQ